MIQVQCIGHSYFYPVSDILRLFTGTIPRQEGEIVMVAYPEEYSITSIVTEESVETKILEKPEYSLSTERNSASLPPNREVKRQLYQVMARLLEKHFPWGSLTGIRPTQVARELSCPEEMTSIYDVREDKARLAFQTKEGEDWVLQESDPRSLHIYIGIPFCPSRCAYCSFVAQEAPKKRELLPTYVDAMLSELDQVLPRITHHLESLYIGGGTPTVLDEELFDRFIRGVFAHPELRDLKEVTVEAGRPDTITERKLQSLLDAGVKRICINPQTLCEETLVRVGRKHSAEDFLRAFSMAREMGFSVINTDLIAGLPGESAEAFCDSLRKIVALSPENITVHSLSKKRRADLDRAEVMKQEEEDLANMEKMLSFASSTLLDAGYVPYYLYKQKDTLGGHENVGYCKPGTECIYNVAMMSDMRSVLSFGAGGMSKRVFFEPGNTGVRIERCPCVKEPTQYIRDVQEMAEKKIRFFENE